MSKDAYREAICSHVIRILREERERRGISMNVLAQRSGLAQSTVSRIEAELRTPSLDTLLRMTEVIGIKLEDTIAAARLAVDRRK